MYHSIRPGQVWLDTEGKRIQAHGGSVMFLNGTYYFYGRIKRRQTGRRISGIGACGAIPQRICIIGKAVV